MSPTFFLWSFLLVAVILTIPTAQQVSTQHKQSSVQLTIKPKQEDNDIIPDKSEIQISDPSANVAVVANETLPANDTEITFWTPVYTYLDKIPKYLSKIPGIKYPLSFVTILAANLVSLALVAATAFMSFFFSPNAMKVITKLTENLANFSTMNPSSVEDLARRVNLAVESYGKIDPEVCLRMASCTLGKERKRKESGNGPWSAGHVLNGTNGQGTKPIHPMLMGIQLLDNFLR